MAKTRPAARREAGAVSLEVVGLILVAALLVSSVALVLTQDNRVGRAASTAVCKILTLGQGSCGEANGSTDAHTPTEPCSTATSGYTMSVEGQATNVEAGKVNAVAIEQLSNGQYRVTVTDASSAGVGTGIGWKAGVTWNDQKWGWEAGADASLGLTGGDQRTYLTNSKQEADDIRNWEIYTASRDTLSGTLPGHNVPGIGWLEDHVVSPTTDFLAQKLGLKKPPAPDSTMYYGGVSGQASAWDTSVNQSASAGASADVLIGYRQNADGTHTMYYSGSAALKASATIVGSTQSFSPDAAFELESTYDKNNTLQSVTVRGITGMNDDSSVHTWTLPVRSDADRAAADNLLHNPLPTTWGAFFEASADHGQMTNVTYRHDDSSYGAGFEGKYMEELGISGELELPKSTVTGAQYYDGQQWQDWEPCHS